ncbi:MAG: hypothetical protein Ct9H300mP8_09360 [Gammaproteobacteria bacterium]|nr:MAG: hypothetical protein Ct9H300mP8_09360 [Gammaproteobacteria bacterium]
MTSERTRRRFVDRLEKNGVSNTRVLAAMDSVPRHVFVDEALAQERTRTLRFRLDLVRRSLSRS